jgi:hypothetical protein
MRWDRKRSNDDFFWKYQNIACFISHKNN